MMAINDETEAKRLARHRANTRIIAKAVHGLHVRFQHLGLDPVQVLEGSIKGAAIALTDEGLTMAEIADLLEDISIAFREPRRPDLRVVQ